MKSNFSMIDMNGDGGIDADCSEFCPVEGPTESSKKTVYPLRRIDYNYQLQTRKLRARYADHGVLFLIARFPTVVDLQSGIT